MKRSYIILFIIPILVMATFVAYTQEEPMDMETCMSCHGSYEDVRALTEQYTTTYYGYDGEYLQPHVYYNFMESNHNSTDPLDCMICHDSHGLDAPTEPVRSSLDYCYSCHHMGMLIKCTECHEY